MAAGLARSERPPVKPDHLLPLGQLGNGSQWMPDKYSQDPVTLTGKGLGSSATKLRPAENSCMCGLRCRRTRATALRYKSSFRCQNCSSTKGRPGNRRLAFCCFVVLPGAAYVPFASVARPERELHEFADRVGNQFAAIRILRKGLAVIRAELGPVDLRHCRCFAGRRKSSGELPC